MRMLFSFVGGNGHFEPLIPIARAAQAAGHQVAVAGQHALVAAIEAAGFVAFAIGKPAGPPERIPLRPLDREREDRDLRDGFADRLARARVAAVGGICAAWQPDIVVCDDVDFGGMLAAEQRGLPYASVVVIAAGSFLRHELLGETLNQVRAACGLPPDPALRMLSRYLMLVPGPPSFRDPAFPPPATARFIRPAAADPGQHAAAWTWDGFVPGAPLVYFTLGTIFNMESGDLFQRVLQGVRALPINVIATVGRDIDPAELGPQPANIRIERFVPQAAILPQCAAIISHGGSGSVIGALAHGLPMVLLPLGADQPFNADRCAALGVARVLDAVATTPEAVRDAVAAVLEQTAYRVAAGRLRAEIMALPGPEHAATLLEHLATTRQPIMG